MLYRITTISNEKLFLNYAFQESKYVSFCTFKSIHKGDLMPSYFDFFKNAENSLFIPNNIDYAPHQHYTKGQKFHYYMLDNEMKKLILEKGLKSWNTPYYPEDIAFYNSRSAWFYTISHENIFYLNSDNPQTIQNLLNIGCEIQC